MTGVHQQHQLSAVCISTNQITKQSEQIVTPAENLGNWNANALKKMPYLEFSLVYQPTSPANAQLRGQLQHPLQQLVMKEKNKDLSWNPQAFWRWTRLKILMSSNQTFLTISRHHGMLLHFRWIIFFTHSLKLSLNKQLGTGWICSLLQSVCYNWMLRLSYVHLRRPHFFPNIFWPPPQTIHHILSHIRRPP